MWEVTAVSDIKKICISIPKSYDNQLSEMSERFSKSKSELIEDAIALFIKQQKSDAVNQQLKKGYSEMSEINLTLAEMYFESENKDFFDYEEKLSESENCEC